MPLCQVKGCRNRSGRAFNKSMFCIPDPIKQRDRCEKWLDFVGREDLLPIKAYESLHNKSRVVCEDHFEPESYELDMRAKIMGYKPRKKLKLDAVPTIPLALIVEAKKHSSKTSSTCSSKRKKQKSSKLMKLGNNGACMEDIFTETPCEEFSIPPLFPSRLPLNDEHEEDEGESNPNSEMQNEEESPYTESTSQCSTVEEQEYDVGPYCKEAGISAADITSHFGDILPLPTIKNGLVLEIIDYLQGTNTYCHKLLIKDLKRLSDTPDLGDWSVGGYLKRLMERRGRIERNTENGERNLMYLCEEESMMTRPKTVSSKTKTHESPRTKSLPKNLQLAKKQRDEAWRCVDLFEKDNQRLKQQNNSLSNRVIELNTENKDLRETVGSLQERCSELEQFKKKYKDLEEKDNQRLKQQNNFLSNRVIELNTENKDLRETVGSLQERCSELEQFKKKYKDLEEKDNQHLKQQNNSLSNDRMIELNRKNKDLRKTVGSLLERCSELEQFKKIYKDLEEKCKKTSSN